MTRLINAWVSGIFFSGIHSDRNMRPRFCQNSRNKNPSNSFFFYWNWLKITQIDQNRNKDLFWEGKKEGKKEGGIRFPLFHLKNKSLVGFSAEEANGLAPSTSRLAIRRTIYIFIIKTFAWNDWFAQSLLRFTLSSVGLHFWNWLQIAFWKLASIYEPFWYGNVKDRKQTLQVQQGVQGCESSSLS